MARSSRSEAQVRHRKPAFRRHVEGRLSSASDFSVLHCNVVKNGPHPSVERLRYGYKLRRNASEVTGSIAYTGALSHQHYDNNVARLTGNVLRRFLRPESLDVVVESKPTA